MGYEKNKTNRIGGLLLDALMLVFVLTFPWSDTKVFDRNTTCAVTISAAPDEQPVYRDCNSIAGSFLKLISKIQLSNSEYSFVVISFPCFEMATDLAFLIGRSSYNTFYRYTTINAP